MLGQDKLSGATGGLGQPGLVTVADGIPYMFDQCAWPHTWAPPAFLEGGGGEGQDRAGGSHLTAECDYGGEGGAGGPG